MDDNQETIPDSLKSAETPDTTVAVITDLLEKHGLLILCSVLFSMLVILFSQYIFGERLMLYKDIGSDSINFDWTQYYTFSNYLRTEGIPKWTFAQGLGQNIFPAYMGQLHVWLLYIINPDDIPYFLIYSKFLTIILGGGGAYLFLRKITSIYLSIIGSVCFAFSGLMIVSSGWLELSTQIAYLAWLLYGLEALRKDNNFFVLPIAVALAAAENPMILYLDGLLLLSYLILSQWQQRDSFWIWSKLILLGFLGVGIGAFFVWGMFYQITHAARVLSFSLSENPLFQKPMFALESVTYYKTFLLRMFSNDMAGYAGISQKMFNGWGNYLEAPAQYCSLLSLLLVPQLFALANRKTKLVAGIALGIAILSVLFPFFRYSFWLFIEDYFRTFSVCFNVLQILLALKALELITTRREVNLSVLVITLVVLLVLVFSINTANDDLRIPVFAFLVMEAGLLWLITQPQFYHIAYVLLPLVVFTEIIFMSWGTFNERDTMMKQDLKKKIGYNDYTIDAMTYIHSIDSSFFRVQKNYNSGLTIHPSMNDGIMQNFYSSASYHQFNQKNYVNFFLKTNLISEAEVKESRGRWISGVGTRLALLQLISNKYLLLKGVTTSMSSIGYDSIAKFDSIQVFRYSHFLPLGFTYNAYIPETEIENLEIPYKDAMLLQGAIIDSSNLSGKIRELKKLSISDTAGTNSTDIYERFSEQLKKDTLQITSFSQNHIEGNIYTESTKLLFFSIPFDEGWKAKIDGKEAKPLILNYGFLGYFLEQGNHKVELTYNVPYYYLCLVISVVSLLVYVGLIAGRYFLIKKRHSA